MTHERGRKIAIRNGHKPLTNYTMNNPNGSKTPWLLFERENGTKGFYYCGSMGWSYAVNASREVDSIISENQSAAYD